MTMTSIKIVLKVIFGHAPPKMILRQVGKSRNILILPDKRKAVPDGKISQLHRIIFLTLKYSGTMCKMKTILCAINNLNQK